jgi:hypothetical protein
VNVLDISSRVLEGIGFILTAASALEKYSHRRFLPFERNLGLILGILLIAISLWIRGRLPI